MNIRIREWDIVKALVKELRLIRIGFMVRCRIWFYCECADQNKGRDSAFDDEGFWLWTKSNVHLGER